MNLNKICMKHLNRIGDLVFSLPLLKALREIFPKATIHSVVKPNRQELLIRLPYVGCLIQREKFYKKRLSF